MEREEIVTPTVGNRVTAVEFEVEMVRKARLAHLAN